MSVLEGRIQPRTPVTTLDLSIEEYGLPDYVKIDVKGGELEVLKGLSTPLPQSSFEFITIQRDIAVACVDYISSLGGHSALIDYRCLAEFIDVSVNVDCRPYFGATDQYLNFSNQYVIFCVNMVNESPLLLSGRLGVCLGYAWESGAAYILNSVPCRLQA